MIYWELFFTFFKIGAFTFGGGYATVSYTHLNPQELRFRRVFLYNTLDEDLT